MTGIKKLIKQEYHRRYYANHREEILARQRAFYREHKDYYAAYNAEHRERLNEQKRAWKEKRAAEAEEGQIGRIAAGDRRH